MQSGKRMRFRRRGGPRVAVGSVIMAMGIVASGAQADIPIFGGPTYDTTTNTGFSPTLSFVPVLTAGGGTAVGTATKYVDGTAVGNRAVRWDASGTAAIELGNLGTDSSGNTTSAANAINSAGTAVGGARRYAAGTLLGSRAVRWDASGTAATELGNLGTDSFGNTTSTADAINTDGTVVGDARKYNGNTYLGQRAVRWAAGSTAATELGNIGTNSSGYTLNSAYAINTDGTAVGFAEIYTGNMLLGTRPVRWDASGTAATELGNLGTDNNGSTESRAWAINTAGTAVGWVDKYTGGINLGARAVRWDASGTAATELGNLGASINGATESIAYAINTAGTAVGYARRYTGGTFVGDRAVRWDASGIAATELGNLGTDSSGSWHSVAIAINAAGTAVGSAEKYTGGADLGSRAVAWGPDSVALELNTLLSPSDQSLWRLNNAFSISDTNWVTGIGAYDPDGTGPLASYNRFFLMQVPEPGSLSLLALGAIALLRRKRP